MKNEKTIFFLFLFHKVNVARLTFPKEKNNILKRNQAQRSSLQERDWHPETQQAGKSQQGWNI